MNNERQQAPDSPMISPFRPHFPTAADYVRNARESLELGRRPWDPKTEAERVAIFAAFPVLARRWFPSLADKEPEVLPDEFCERLLATLEKDPQLCKAMAALIKGAA